MTRLKPLLLILLFTLLSCDNKTFENPHLAQDYQRIDADWLTHDEAKLRQQTVSNIKYILQIDLTKPERYSGTVEIQFDYQPSQFPLTLDFVGGEAERILVNSQPIAIDYSGNFINILPKQLDVGANIVKVQFSHPYSDNGSGLYRYVDPADKRIYLYSHFEPYDANRLFPHFDQPNLRAIYKLKVVAPKQWTVISSVLETEIITDGAYSRWSFPESPSISSYVFPLHAGPWHIWEGNAGKTPIRLMARKSLSKLIDVREWFRLTQQGFKFYEEYFDIPYPYSKYDQLLVPDFNIGGMENVGAVTFTENYIPRGAVTKARKRRIAKTILHELSHMWFGDLVTIDWWSDLWLKESFASYMAPLALSEATQYKDAWRAFYATTKQGAYRADQRVTTHPISMPVTDTKSGDASFDSITYNKGASVLQQLAHYLGKEKFRNGIRAYLKKYNNQAAQLDDFLTTLENSSNQNLQQWTNDWINSASLNTVSTEYQCKDGEITKFFLKQSAPENYPTLREHKLQLGLYHKDSDQQISAFTVKTVNLKGKETIVKSVIGLDCPLMVYPNHGDWGYIKVALDKKTLLMLPDNLSNIADPLTRAMFWQSLWDMVRDVQMPLTTYLELALSNISFETDSEILIQVLSNLNQASDWINSSEEINNQGKLLLKNIEQLMFENIKISTTGSDLHKIWFEQFIGLAQSEWSLNYLSQWLQNQRQPKQLAKNQELRWQAIIAVSASGHPDGEALIKIEEINDLSDKGAMNALAARASQPNLAIKQYWLDELIKKEDRQSAAKLKQAMEYLFPIGQSEFHKPFAEKILTDLYYLDKYRGQVLVETLVYSILPSLCTEQSVELLKSAQSDMHTLGLIAQKGIQITHQEDQRCVDINRFINRDLTED